MNSGAISQPKASTITSVGASCAPGAGRASRAAPRQGQPCGAIQARAEASSTHRRTRWPCPPAGLPGASTRQCRQSCRSRGRTRPTAMWAGWSKWGVGSAHIVVHVASIRKLALPTPGRRAGRPAALAASYPQRMALGEGPAGPQGAFHGMRRWSTSRRATLERDSSDARTT